MARAIAANMFVGSGCEFMSAGVRAADGDLASLGARDAVSQIGLDLSGHRAQALTHELANESTLILTMTKAHRDAVCERFPDIADKVHLISEYAGKSGDVLDPFGQNTQVYASCRDLLEVYINEIIAALKST